MVVSQRGGVEVDRLYNYGERRLGQNSCSLALMFMFGYLNIFFSFFLFSIRAYCMHCFLFQFMFLGLKNEMNHLNIYLLFDEFVNL